MAPCGCCTAWPRPADLAAASSWAVTENNRQAKYYRLTAAGRRQLEEETTTWRQYAEAVRLVLQMT